jgi:hypothetical protein
MNRTFDYRGVQVAPSNPVAKLRTVKKTIYIDSGDRDIVKYERNGDFVIYLPRVYENVVCISLKGAEFPPVNAGVTGVQQWDKSPSAGGGPASSNLASPAPAYFFIEVDGLNRADETAINANRSASIDSVFAKIQVPDTTSRIIYSEDSGPTNINYYQPAIGRLDRLAIRTRLHNQNPNQSIYWADISAEIKQNYSLTLEVTTMENSFDDFSSMETRLSERGMGGFGC